MARVTYTEEQITEFISVAQERGISPAMRELGYPGSHHTAAKWFEMYGLELPDVSYLQRKARAMKEFYTDREELAAVQLMIDRLTESLESTDMDADALNKIANALQRAIQTKRLIEGKSTTTTENHSKDGKDLLVIDLINEQKAKNALAAQNLNAENSE